MALTLLDFAYRCVLGDLLFLVSIIRTCFFFCLDFFQYKMLTGKQSNQPSPNKLAKLKCAIVFGRQSKIKKS